MNKLLQTWLRNLPWFVLSVILVPTLVGVLTSIYFRTYDATASLWVESQASATVDPSSSKTIADVYAGNLTQLLLTTSFRRQILDDLKAHDGVATGTSDLQDAWLKKIGSGVKVTTRGSNLIEIHFRDANSTIATAVVAAVVNDFQQRTLQIKKNATIQTVSEYEKQIRLIRDDVASAQRRLNALPPNTPDSVRAELTLDIQSNQDLLKAIEDRQNQTYSQNIADLVSVPGTLQVIDAPHTDPRNRTNLADLALAVIATLVITLTFDVGVIAVLTVVDERVHRAADLAAFSELPIVEVQRVHTVRPGDRWPALRRRLFGQ